MNQNSVILNGKKYHSTELAAIPTDEEWQKDIVSFLEQWFDNTEAIAVQTSGSTGEPKTILLPKASMVNSAVVTNAFFSLSESSNALLCLPAAYIAGKMMLVRAIVGAYNLLCVPPTANPFTELASTIDFTAVTPYQLQSAEKCNLSQLKNIIVGGAPVSTKLEADCFGCHAAIYETYGMTETCSHIALRKLNQDSCFQLLAGVNMLQDDRDCLVILAPHLTQEELHTNDIVELTDDTHFKWVGRADNVINTGGVKVSPEQVEKKLSKYISPRFFVTSVPDSNLGQQVVLVIESEKEIENLDEVLAKTLTKFEMPKQVFYLGQFRYSDNGKVLRQETMSAILSQ